MQKNIQTMIISSIKKYDPNLWTHCLQTANIAKQVAVYLDFRTPDIDNLYCAALIHDIGKIFINPEILMKPDKLTPAERKTVDMHSLLGYIYTTSLGVDKNIAELILLHHGYDKERYGKSYSEKNRLPANILRACDIFDAVTHDRPYHEKVSYTEGIQIVRLQKDLEDNILEALAESAKKDVFC